MAKDIFRIARHLKQDGDLQSLNSGALEIKRGCVTTEIIIFLFFF